MGHTYCNYDECKSIGIQWRALYVNSFGVENIPKEIA